jgi:ubiquinone/menaquinone biosynthesis C-methylase UbiE
MGGNFSAYAEVHFSRRKSRTEGLLMTQLLNIEQIVQERYAAGARQAESALCCPVTYNPRYLAVLPQEILAKDYGCGDPSQYLHPGETVLDLGCGAGKICYIAAQIVGPSGRVIGVDMTPDMLAVAEKYRQQIGELLGFHNVEFRRGKIQDLRTALNAVDDYLRRHPVASLPDLQAFEAFLTEQRTRHPLVVDDSIDVVVSNCVLNLVRDEDKRQLFAEIFRVLKNGGRAVIADIVADEPVPAHLKNDPALWSGCISGALQEHEFLQAFAEAGFYGMEILKRDEQPWRTVEGIEFRSLTLAAYKGKQGPCWDCNQAVIYKGPWSEVKDDDGHTLIRGVPMAVCEKTFRLYTREPYAHDIIPVPPLTSIALKDAQPFDCSRDAVRSPRETKGLEYRVTTDAAACCEPGKCC